MDRIYGNAVVIDGGEVSISTVIDGGEIGVFYNIGAGGVVYPGPYDVIPIFEAIELETAHKLASRNITVEAIPVARVDNPQGGKTITIGG